MDEYEIYEKQVAIIEEENKEYLIIFKNALEEKGLSEETIYTHISNIDFFLNYFLVAYDPLRMKDGCYEIDNFLGEWFLRKATWASKASVQSNCASLKKFYKVMLSCGYIEVKDYQVVVDTIKQNKQNWIDKIVEQTRLAQEELRKLWS